MEQDRLELYQLKKSAVLRHNAGRAAPVDRLAALLAVRDADAMPVALAAAPADPAAVIAAVPAAELPGAIAAAARFEALERDAAGREFWRWALFLLRARQRPPAFEVSAVVGPRVDAVLAQRSYAELVALSAQTEREEARQPDNAAYWAEVRARAQARAAELHLREVYDTLRAAAGALRPAQERAAAPPQSAFAQFARARAARRDDMLEFDSLVADDDGGGGQVPEYVNFALLGEASNYVPKGAVAHAEPWLAGEVVGYDFALFYPELEAAGLETPAFATAKAADGTARLTFSAKGYRDMTFRIRDEPWEHGRFRDTRPESTFDRGVLRLRFKFKRAYKR